MLGQPHVIGQHLHALLLFHHRDFARLSVNDFFHDLDFGGIPQYLVIVLKGEGDHPVQREDVYKHQRQQQQVHEQCLGFESETLFFAGNDVDLLGDESVLLHDTFSPLSLNARLISKAKIKHSTISITAMALPRP